MHNVLTIVMVEPSLPLLIVSDREELTLCDYLCHATNYEFAIVTCDFWFYACINRHNYIVIINGFIAAHKVIIF